LYQKKPRLASKIGPFDHNIYRCYPKIEDKLLINRGVLPMNYSTFSRMRDCFFLCALLFLMKTAYDRNYTFLCAHKQSIIHELDRNVIDQLYTTQRHVHFLQEHHIHGDTYAHAIADIKERLTTIEEKYHKNSPGLALLGPIGSAAIVAKEEVLQQKLLDIVNDVNKILCTICNMEAFKPTESINDGLIINKNLISRLDDLA
jgi:hypothetical protein